MPRAFLSEKEKSATWIELFGTILFVISKIVALVLILGWLLNEDLRTLDTLFYIVSAIYFAASGLWYRHTF